MKSKKQNVAVKKTSLVVKDIQLHDTIGGGGGGGSGGKRENLLMVLLKR